MTGGAAVATRISSHVLGHANDYATIVATADWHEDPGGHFAQQPDFIHSWPPHCRIGTHGAQFHPATKPAFEHVAAIFRKGEHAAAYSGFEGFAAQNDKPIALAQWLRDRDIEQVDIVGIATDHCVRATALDAATKGFTTTVLLGLTAGVSHQSTQAALAAMRAAGIQLVGDCPL